MTAVASLPKTLEQRVAQTSLSVFSIKAPTKRWKAIRDGFAVLDEVDAKYPGAPLVLHKRLNLLGYAMELLLTSPRVARSQTPALLLAFARETLARMPSKIAHDSPFGAACETAWVLAHRALAEHDPARKKTWSRDLARFDKAALAARNAPRTHSEGRLKTTKAHRALFTLGREMPWYATPSSDRAE